jgi:hypothetical protein
MLEDANGAAPVADAASTAAPISEAPAESAAPSIRDTMAAVLKKYPVQGDDGRFESRFPRDEPATDAAPDKAAPAAVETSDQPETLQAETAPAPSIEPPASWSADVKAKWAALPPDVQAYIAKREGEAHQAITQAGAKLKGYEGLDAVIGPRRDALRASWGDEGAAIKQLFDLSDFATRDPAGFVQWFASQNRVDLSRLTTAPANAALADPQVAALQHEIQTIKSNLTQQQMAQMDADIRRFADAKGDDGAPLRPHFDEVKAEMGRLIQAGIAATLEDAYAKAIRTNDAVWAKVQAEEAAKRAKAEADKQAKAREEAARAAKEAQRSASVNVRATGGVSGSPARAQTMRETMEAVARRAYGAA